MISNTAAIHEETFSHIHIECDNLMNGSHRGFVFEIP